MRGYLFILEHDGFLEALPRQRTRVRSACREDVRGHLVVREALECDRINMAWKLPGMISDGGISFLRLQDGRLALLICLPCGWRAGDLMCFGGVTKCCWVRWRWERWSYPAGKMGIRGVLF